MRLSGQRFSPLQLHTTYPLHYSPTCNHHTLVPCDRISHRDYCVHGSLRSSKQAFTDIYARLLVCPHHHMKVIQFDCSTICAKGFRTVFLQVHVRLLIFHSLIQVRNRCRRILSPLLYALDGQHARMYVSPVRYHSRFLLPEA